MNPQGAMKLLGNAALDEVAAEVGAALSRVVAAVGTAG
jgi:hypothetical protein